MLIAKIHCTEEMDSGIQMEYFDPAMSGSLESLTSVWKVSPFVSVVSADTKPTAIANTAIGISFVIGLSLEIFVFREWAEVAFGPEQPVEKEELWIAQFYRLLK